MRVDRRIWPLATVGHMALLMALSLRPNMAPQDASWVKEMMHNALHVPGYAVLTFLLVKTWGGRADRRKVGVMVFCAAFAYGAVIEVLQSFVPGRLPSGLDLTLNTSGILLVLILFARGVVTAREVKEGQSGNQG